MMKQIIAILLLFPIVVLAANYRALWLDTINQADIDTRGFWLSVDATNSRNYALLMNFSDDATPSYYDSSESLSDSGNVNDGAQPSAGARPAYSNTVEIGGFYQFDGGDDAIRIPDSDDFSFAGSQATIMYWFRWDTNDTDGWTISKDNSNNTDTREWVVRQRTLSSANQFVVYGDPSTAFISRDFGTNGVLEDGNWHHVACTYDGADNEDSLNCYIDGAIANAVGATGGGFTISHNSTSVVVICGNDKNPSTAGSKGGMDEVCIIKHELTSNEVYETYLSGSTNGTGSH